MRVNDWNVGNLCVIINQTDYFKPLPICLRVIAVSLSQTVMGDRLPLTGEDITFGQLECRQLVTKHSMQSLSNHQFLLVVRRPATYFYSSVTETLADSEKIAQETKTEWMIG